MTEPADKNDPRFTPEDPRFQEQPTGRDFNQLVAVVKTYEREKRSAEGEIGEKIVIMPHDTDPYTVAWFSQRRVIEHRTMIPDDGDPKTPTGREAALWVDGFNLGMRFAEHRAKTNTDDVFDFLDNATPTDVDGNRRQRRRRR